MRAQWLGGEPGRHILTLRALFTTPGDGNPNFYYSLYLTQNEVRVHECKPKCTVLGKAPATRDEPHTLVIQLQDGAIGFLVDGQPLDLDKKATFSSDAKWKTWQIEGMIWNAHSASTPLEAAVDWVAIRRP